MAKADSLSYYALVSFCGYGLFAVNLSHLGSVFILY